jgi:DNA-binding NarL/FixJ family response regulator
MKVKYEFNNGEVTEVEISEEIGAMIIDSRRKEESDNKKEHRHCYSLDAVAYEGIEYGTPDFTEEMFDDCEERNAHVCEVFSRLSSVQQHRLLMLASGLSIREIARREGKNFRTVYDSIEAAKKKFLKFF